MKTEMRTAQECTNTATVQPVEQYEAPRIEVIEMEIEGPILNMSDFEPGRF